MSVSHIGGGVDDEITNGGGVCGCSRGVGSFGLALCCPCIAYGQTRERAGLQGCLPAALSLVIPLAIVQLIVGCLGVAMYKLDNDYFLEACVVYESQWDPDYEDNDGTYGTLIFFKDNLDNCSGDDFFLVINAVRALLALLSMAIFASLLGPTRTDLQRVTGVADGGCANLLLGGCCWVCVLAQEHRIIERKWKANSERPLKPMATVPASTPYSQIGFE